MEQDRHNLITVIPANAQQRIVEAIEAALSIRERSVAALPFEALDRIKKLAG